MTRARVKPEPTGEGEGEGEGEQQQPQLEASEEQEQEQPPPRDDRNPLNHTTYDQLSLRTRVLLMKALCDWRLDEEPEPGVRDAVIDDAKFEPWQLRVDPLGWDCFGLGCS